MAKTILITGSTDGIGLACATKLAASGLRVLLHGRSEAKLQVAKQKICEQTGQAKIETYAADLSVFAELHQLAAMIACKHQQLDVLINNAGVYITPDRVTADGLDTRFMVNTIAPYYLSKQLMPILQPGSRIINLSSAAQAAVDPAHLSELNSLSDSAAYAQSKLALTMWSQGLARLCDTATGPSVIAVNPGSMLGSKMVKQAYGVKGKDIQLGADILYQLALGDEYKGVTGKYFDNDIGQFSLPHSDALDEKKIDAVVQAIESVLGKLENGKFVR